MEKEVKFVSPVESFEDQLLKMPLVVKQAFTYAAANALITERHLDTFVKGAKISKEAKELSKSVILHDEKELGGLNKAQMQYAARSTKGLLFSIPFDDKLYLARMVS